MMVTVLKCWWVFRYFWNVKKRSPRSPSFYLHKPSPTLILIKNIHVIPFKAVFAFPELPQIVSNQTEQVSNQVPIESDQAPIPSDQLPIISDQVPIISDQVPQISDQVNQTSNQVPQPEDQTGPAQISNQGSFQIDHWLANALWAFISLAESVFE